MTSGDWGDYLIYVTDDTSTQQRQDGVASPLALVSDGGSGLGPTPGSEDSAKDEFDPSKKFVRITGIQQNRLIEFDFSVGEPELYIELVLPFQAFQDFCANNKVTHLNAEQAAAVDYDRLKWRSGSPGVEH